MKKVLSIFLALIMVFSCTNEGGKETKTETVKALGHDWDEGAVTKEPTKKETGEMVITCKTCGETKTEEIAVLESTGVPAWGWIVIGAAVVGGVTWFILAKRRKEDKEEAKH